MWLHGERFQFVLLVEILLTAATATLASSIAKPRCDDSCGDLKIPYPFGKTPDCYLNQDFFINCTDVNNSPKPFWRESNIVVANISMDGCLKILNVVTEDCYKEGQPEPSITWAWLFSSKFRVSNSKNKFTVIGCDSYGYIEGYRDEHFYRTGCISFCDSTTIVYDGSCTGNACCQIEIPKGLTKINVTAYSFKNHKGVSDLNPCTYAFLTEESQFNFSSSYLKKKPQDEFPLVLDWTITGDGKCEEASNKSTYACKENSECRVPDEDSSGYLCKCKEGYQGNPYLSNGCKDIDECEHQDLNNCTDICVNQEQNYTCSCPQGYHGDGRKDGEGCVANLPYQFPLVKVALGVGIFFVVMLVSISWLFLVLKKRKLIKRKEMFFQQNGGFLLQQKLSQGTGSSRKANFKIFVAEELSKATNNYAENMIVGRGGYGTVYKGFLTKDNLVAIKKSKIVDQSQIEQFINEIVVLSQIEHKNVVRLLGCCLETDVPLLVYEFISNGTLSEHIHNKDKAPTISAEIRLKIAAETAGVLSHLHSASTSIIHRDVKTANILLDHEYNAKVSDFGASKLVPMNVTQLSTMVQGTIGYLDPEYFQTGKLTDKSDVYSFGVVLVELLTGQRALMFDRPEELRSLVVYFLSSLKQGRLYKILENHIVNDGNKEQLREVAELARRCLSVKGEERPPMREVAMELAGLRMIHKHSWDNTVNPEETESLLYGTSDAYKAVDDGSTTAGYDSITAAFDVDARRLLQDVTLCLVIVLCDYVYLLLSSFLYPKKD